MFSLFRSCPDAGLRHTRCSGPAHAWAQRHSPWRWRGGTRPSPAAAGPPPGCHSGRPRAAGSGRSAKGGAGSGSVSDLSCPEATGKRGTEVHPVKSLMSSIGTEESKQTLPSEFTLETPTRGTLAALTLRSGTLTARTWARPGRPLWRTRSGPATGTMVGPPVPRAGCTFPAESAATRRCSSSLATVRLPYLAATCSGVKPF